MPDPANSRTDRDGQRTYTWDGIEYPSVTSVLSVVSKPALVPGARKVQAEEILFNLPEYLGMLWQQGNDPTALERVRMSASRRAKAKWDLTADQGSRVHAAVERWLREPDYQSWDPDQEVQPYLEQFAIWWDTVKPTLLHTEVTGYNRKFNYAGTTDLILEGYFTDPFTSETIVVDIKSGNNVYPDFALQLAAYRQFEFLVVDDAEAPMPQTDGAAILHLRPDHCTLVPVNAGFEAFRGFLAARELHQWVFVDSKGAFTDAAT